MAKKLTEADMKRIPPMSSDRKSLPRITQVWNFHHQFEGENPTSIQNIVAEHLESEGEVYTRRVKIGKDWTPIDLGWLKDQPIRLIIIENVEGTKLASVPSKEQVAEINRRVVQIAANSHTGLILRVPPGWGHPIQALDCTNLEVRCEDGAANCKITIIPK